MEDAVRSSYELISLSFYNPSVNDRTARVDFRLSLPQGIHLTGIQNIREGSGANVIGFETVEPGSQAALTVNIQIDPSFVGDAMIEYQVLYYPVDQKKDFKVFEEGTIELPVAQGEEPGSSDGRESGGSEGGSGSIEVDSIRIPIPSGIPRSYVLGGCWS